MARLFMVSVIHDSVTRWATIVNYPDSPASFEVSFFQEFGPADIPTIILEKKNGRLELAKDSPEINEELVKAVVTALENHTVERNLSL